MKVYILKGWHRNTDRGEWINHKVTLSEKDAEFWIESPFRQMDGEGPDPNHDYDVLDLKCSDSFIDEMVEEKANEWAKEVGETEPDWRRKQIVRDFTEGFKLAVALYYKEKEKPAKHEFGDIVNDVVAKGFNEDAQSGTLTGVAIKSEPRKWKGWNDENYIPGRMVVYNADVFKNKFPNINVIALENNKGDWDKLNKTEKFAVAIAGNKYFVTNPDYQHMIDDIIPVDDGLKVMIKDKKYKKDLEKSIFPYGVCGDKKDPYSWEYAEIPFKFEVKKEKKDD